MASRDDWRDVWETLDAEAASSSSPPPPAFSVTPPQARAGRHAAIPPLVAAAIDPSPTVIARIKQQHLQRPNVNVVIPSTCTLTSSTLVSPPPRCIASALPKPFRDSLKSFEGIESALFGDVAASAAPLRTSRETPRKPASPPTVMLDSYASAVTSRHSALFGAAEAPQMLVSSETTKLDGLPDEGDVVRRLTDPAHFTGTQRLKFTSPYRPCRRRSPSSRPDALEEWVTQLRLRPARQVTVGQRQQEVQPPQQRPVATPSSCALRTFPLVVGRTSEVQSLPVPRDGVLSDSAIPGGRIFVADVATSGGASRPATVVVDF